MVAKLLVANRGEIAVRVMRTASEMGIATVAVYSEADENAPHVTMADEAVLLGGPEPSESYLNADRIVQAALATGADAIHPGYGFLSESASFAERVIDAGLTFVGPSPSAMRALGSKLRARQLAVEAGVPIIPGMTAASTDAGELHALTADLAYPVLVKASAGGGGKGMRLVSCAENLAHQVTQASSEARGAFGDATVYLEKVIPHARHVEFQVLADQHGHTVHLFERECSVQRRHQKIVEETPSPALSPQVRKRMGLAAVTLLSMAGYTSAGTVEFLLDDEGNFYFLEVNTRLQVEHPITEMVTGLDLVRHQIEIARGKPLGFSQQDVSQRGHAIECRVYAEDPARQFMPSPGTIVFAKEPSGPGVRFDGAVRSGMAVPVHYDPILAKVITWGESRQAAVARMLRALRECVILGVATPIELLIDVIGSSPFAQGLTHTGFLDEHFASWSPADTSPEMEELMQAAVQSSQAKARQRAITASVAPIDSPWHRLGRWQLGAPVSAKEGG